MEKRIIASKGLVFGKFLPPHNGHVFLVSEAQKQVDELIILLCSRKRDPIPGYLRAEWMRKLFPDAIVKHMTDEIPAYPHEHPEFWKFWLQAMEKYCEGVEVVFTSENYGDELAEKMGIQHVEVDIGRQHFPVSGTAVRKEPFRFWEMIPEVVRPYYVRKVVLTGPESCGKTVLAEKLATHYNTTFVPEYGREYMVGNNLKLIAEDISRIAAGQLELEEKQARQANKILFCDTDLIVTQIWSEMYFKQCPEWILDVNHQRHYDLHLLMDCDIPWVDDGTRSFKHLRKFHFERIKAELESRNLPYAVISGDFETRFQIAKQIIDEYIFRTDSITF